MQTLTKTFDVTGMSCGHCENAIREEVTELKGVSNINVDAKTGLLEVTFEAGSEASDAEIIAAVDEAGYAATPSGA